MRTNSIKRISFQRNKLLDCLSEANDEDYIFYSDNDEIPNFDNFNFNSQDGKIFIFKQSIIVYFNFRSWLKLVQN